MTNNLGPSAHTTALGKGQLLGLRRAETFPHQTIQFRRFGVVTSTKSTLGSRSNLLRADIERVFLERETVVRPLFPVPCFRPLFRVERETVVRPLFRVLFSTPCQYQFSNR